MNRHKQQTPEKPKQKANLKQEKHMQTIQFKNNSTTSRRGTIPPLETSNPTSAPRTRHSLLLAIATLGLTLIFNPVAASAAPQLFEASGVTPADILTDVTACRNSLGHNNA